MVNKTTEIITFLIYIFVFFTIFEGMKARKALCKESNDILNPVLKHVSVERLKQALYEVNKMNMDIRRSYRVDNETMSFKTGKL